jgi:hypothetical protein
MIFNGWSGDMCSNKISNINNNQIISIPSNTLMTYFLLRLYAITPIADTIANKESILGSDT